jgi:hypothetical protein
MRVVACLVLLLSSCAQRTERIHDAGALKAHFNAAKDVTRVVVLLSPT